MPVLPTGTVTFLFTDIESSTRQWDAHPEPMGAALRRHDTLMREAIDTNNGKVFKTVGDAFCAAFPTAPSALNATLAVQLALQAESWQEPIRVRVRMALHTGAAEERDGDYFGPPLNRVARLLSLAHGGQTLLSDVTHDLIRDSLPPSVSVLNLGEHRLKDLSRSEQVFQLCHLDLPSEFPPLNSLNHRPNNLPRQVTSFIGRETEMAEVKRLLDTTRCLTLTGSGGCGKTRLALQVAADLLHQFPDGLWQVELAPLADAALVTQTVASALGVTEAAGQPLQQTLTESLKNKRLLLLLDNCEHLLDACAELTSALLRSCAAVKVLATSREALGIGGEQSFRVPSLSVPDPKRAVTDETLLQYEAARLFIERAQRVQSDFALTARNAPALASICSHLDGIPLAIELAAARVRSMSVEEIDTRLDQRFRLLTGGSKTALPRQQTLRALIDWSYDLLDAQEYLLLCRLSVFAGDWTLAAAEIVGAGASESAQSIEDWEVLDLLTSLVDKSLVIAGTQGGSTRYRLMETMRQYARDRLTESGESLGVRARHRDYFLKQAEEVKPKLSGSEQAHWLATLEEEHDNLRAALTWCLEEPQGTQTGLRLCAALQLFWQVRGHLSEGRARLSLLLSRSDAQEHTKVRADALNGGGVLASLQGDYASAHSLYEESLAIARELGDRQGIARSFNNLGNVAHDQGDFDSARSLYEVSLAIGHELGDRQGIARSLNNLGSAAYEQSDYASAHSLYKESLAIARELGNRQGIARSFNNLGNVAHDQGDFDSARSLFEESLAIFGELEDRWGIAYSLEAFASLAVKQESDERAVRLWGAASALREGIGSPLSPDEHDKQEHEAAKAREALGEAAFIAAWEEGRAMTWEQAVEHALDKS